MDPTEMDEETKGYWNKQRDKILSSMRKKNNDDEQRALSYGSAGAS
jgi:hypothetical protein